MTHSRKAFWLLFAGGLIFYVVLLGAPMIAGHITAEAPVSQR